MSYPVLGTIAGSSDFTSQQFSVSVKGEIAVGSQANVGQGIVLRRTTLQRFEWNSEDGNNGWLENDGTMLTAYAAALARSSNSGPREVAIPTGSAVSKVPDSVSSSCLFAGASLGAASLALAVAIAAAAAEVGINPLADAGVYVASIAYGTAYGAYLHECAL